MHHRLFIAALKIGKRGVLQQRLSDTGHITVTKNAKTATKKKLFFSISFHVLILQEQNRSLRHRQSLCFLCHMSSLISLIGESTAFFNQLHYFG